MYALDERQNYLPSIGSISIPRRLEGDGRNVCVTALAVRVGFKGGNYAGQPRRYFGRLEFALYLVFSTSGVPWYYAEWPWRSQSVVAEVSVKATHCQEDVGVADWFVVHRSEILVRYRTSILRARRIFTLA